MGSEPDSSRASFDGQPGKLLGHYRILEKIGEGGMGVVYRARDERLDRDVALKVLSAATLRDEDARKRFRSEALALSRLNHSNIATVFDFDTKDGVSFLVMEYLPGQSLEGKLRSGALPHQEIRTLGAQLAQGLAAAHECGVIHRDLKPANLHVLADGRLKILDFGLAKRMAPDTVCSPNSETSDDLTTITKSLVEAPNAAGTLPYMAPEQVRGEAADARTDIYAVGTVLYEMASGKRAFPAEQGATLIGDVLHKAPAALRSLNPGIPEALEAVVTRALTKDPAGRYQSARELQTAIEGIGTRASAAPGTKRKIAWIVALAAALVLGIVALAYGWIVRLGSRAVTQRPIESLAVLPLDNLSKDAEQDYFAEGMTEALIAQLAKIGALRVTSRTSVLRYKGTKKDLPEIARELNVDAILEGSVVHAGSRVRITTELFDARADKSLWAESYERDLRDVLSLQSDIAGTVAAQIRVKVSPGEKALIAVNRTVNPEAYEAYLKGRYYWNQRTEASMLRGVRYFELAVEKDGGYAPAFSGLADSWSGQAHYELVSPAEAFPHVKGAALRAIELDENSAEAHTSLAIAYYFHDHNWAAAEVEFRRALALNSHYTFAHHLYSDYLSAMGRHDEALKEEQQALGIEPLSLIVNTWIGRRYYHARRYDEALAAVKKAIELDSDFAPGLLQMGLICVQLRKYDQAIQALQHAVDVSRDALQYQAALAYANAEAGTSGRARAILARIQARGQQYQPSYLIAETYLAMGDKVQALKWLGKAVDEGSVWLVYAGIDPRLDSVRADPAFAALLRRASVPSVQ